MNFRYLTLVKPQQNHSAATLYRKARLELIKELDTSSIHKLKMQDVLSQTSKFPGRSEADQAYPLSNCEKYG